MKKILFLFFALFAMCAVVSCGKDEGQDLHTSWPATYSGIQGTWRMEKNGTYFTYIFEGSAYILTVRNVFSTSPHTTEMGTYTMEGNTITLTPYEGTAVCSTLEAYWGREDHYFLNLIPLGVFTRQ